MGCKKGKKPKRKAKPGRFECEKCGYVAKSKKAVCKPVEIEDPGAAGTEEEKKTRNRAKKGK